MKFPWRSHGGVFIAANEQACLIRHHVYSSFLLLRRDGSHVIRGCPDVWNLALYGERVYQFSSMDNGVTSIRESIDDEWQLVYENRNLKVTAYTCYNNKFYCIIEHNRLFIIDPDTQTGVFQNNYLPQRSFRAIECGYCFYKDEAEELRILDLTKPDAISIEVAGSGGWKFIQATERFVFLQNPGVGIIAACVKTGKVLASYPVEHPENAGLQVEVANGMLYVVVAGTELKIIDDLNSCQLQSIPFENPTRIQLFANRILYKSVRPSASYPNEFRELMYVPKGIQMKEVVVGCAKFIAFLAAGIFLVKLPNPGE